MTVYRIDVDRTNFIKSLKQCLNSKPEDSSDRLAKVGKQVVEQLINMFEYDDALFEFLIDLAVEKLEVRDGICMYEFHRSVADIIHVDGVCRACGKHESEHQQVLCCPEHPHIENAYSESEASQ